MALDFNKLNKVNIPQGEQITSPQPTVEPKPAAPIKFDAQANSEYINVIQSEAFQNLDQEGQLKFLQLQFPNIKAPELKNILQQVNTYLQNQPVQRFVSPDQNYDAERETLTTKYNSSITEYALHELCGNDNRKFAELKKDPNFVKKLVAIANPESKEDLNNLLRSLGAEGLKIEFEDHVQNSAINYATKAGIQNPSFDDLNALSLKLKKKDPKRLTGADRTFIHYVEILRNDNYVMDGTDLIIKRQTNRSISFIYQNLEVFENAIPKNVKESPEWKKKSPQEKLNARMDAFLRKTDDRYAALTDQKEKDKYIYETLRRIVDTDQYRNGNRTKISNKEADYHISVMAFALDAAEAKGISAKYILNTAGDEGKIFSLLVDVADEKQLLNGYFNSDDSVNKAKDPLLNVAYSIMSGIDKSAFDRMTPHEQERIAKTIICQMGQKLYGDDWTTVYGRPNEEFSKNGDRLKSFRVRFEAVKHAGEKTHATKTLKDVVGDFSNPNFDRRTFIENSIKEDTEYCTEVLGIDLTKDAQYQLQCETKRRTGKLTVTKNDLLQTIQAKEKQGIKLSRQDKETKIDLQTENQVQPESGEDTSSVEHQMLFQKYIKEGRSAAEFAIDQYLDGDGSKLEEWLSNPENIKCLVYDANPKTPEQVDKILNSLNITKGSELYEQVQTAFASKLTINQTADVVIALELDHDVDGASKKWAMVKDTAEGRGVHEMVNLAIERVLPNLEAPPQEKEVFLTKAAIQTANGKYAQSYGESWGHAWNSEQLSQDGMGERIAHTVLSSANASAEFKSSATESFVKFAADDAARVSHAKALSDIDDAAVTEGLINGYKYVESESARAEYNSQVNNSINNLSDTAEKQRLTQKYEEVKSTVNESDDSPKSSDTSNNTNKSGNTSSPAHTQQTSNHTTTTAKARNVAASATAAELTPEGKKSVQQLQTLVAKLSSQQSQQSKDQALRQLERIITKIQDDVKAYNTKKLEHAKKAEAAEQAQKEEDIKKAQEQGQRIQEKNVEIIENAGSEDIAQAAVELVTEFEQQEQKYSVIGISQEVIAEFKQAKGDITKIYDIVSKNLSGDMQNRFMAHLAKAKPYLIKDFITKYKNDPAVLKQLVDLNPDLMSMLEPDTLLACGFDAKDILSHGDKNTLSRMFYDLAREGSSARETLNTFYEAMGVKPDNDSQNAAELVKKNDLSDVPGSDEWFANNFGGTGSSVVSNYKFDGGTAQDLTRKYFNNWT